MAHSSLRVLPYTVGAPEENMESDRALLHAEGPPTLRFYGWNPPAISLGHFQGRRRGEDSPDHLLAAGLPVVRRMTGGGAIVHWHELTYALVLPVDHVLIDGLSTEASYRVLHAPIVRVLQALGAPVTQRLSDDPGRHAALCFDRTTSLDLEALGKKLVGSAQRRTERRVLQHGSIILRTNPLQPGTAALDDLLATPVTPTELTSLLAAAFESLFAS